MGREFLPDMNISKTDIKAITFDFYLTLAHPRGGRTRGEVFQEYLRRMGMKADPWEHKVNYDVFPFYGQAYHPDLSEEEKRAFWTEFTRRLFERTRVSGPVATDYARHAAAIRLMFGSQCLEPYEEVFEALAGLKRAGARLAIISNWPHGLGYFCRELGLADFMEFILASAEFGCQKPDGRIFGEACRLFNLAPQQILHVGDDPVEDNLGAREASFPTLRVLRDGQAASGDFPSIRNLRELLPLFVA